MAVTFLEVPFRADVVYRDRLRWRRPRWLLPVVISLLIVGVLGGSAARITYAATYQPLAFDSGDYGPQSAGWKPVNDGFETTRWLLTAKAGATATFAYGIENRGSDPITIYDVPDAPGDWIYTSWRWASTLYYSPAIHRLPAVVAPHQTIELLYSIRKPACQPDTADTEINALVVHYRAFGFSHTLTAPMVGRTLEPIEVCWHQR